MSDLNPWKPKQVANHTHVQTIVTEAMQEWIQKHKLPYEVEGDRGPIELGMGDMYIIQGVLRSLIHEHKDIVDNALIKGASRDE